VKNANFPRVLIVNGEPFNSSSATGITLSNLFRGWPKEKIAQVYTSKTQPDLNLCNKNWRLSNRDLLFASQLNQMRKRNSNPAGNTISVNTNLNHQPAGLLSAKNGKLRNLLIPWIDLLPYQFSSEFLKWIEDFKPQLIYSLLGNIRLIGAVEQLSSRFSIPVVPHFMDDWISTYSSPGYGRISTDFHKNIIQKRLLHLMKRSPNGLSIGDAMAEEYKKKFNIPFEAFMNPIQPSDALLGNSSRPELPIQFVYVGGLHLSRWENLKEIGESMVELRKDGLEVQLLVYAPRSDILEYRSVLESVQVQVCGTLAPEEVPGVLQRSHVVVHVESFQKMDMQYTRLSVSTKIPQYFAAGLPVFAYAPSEVASSRYVRDSNAGFVVGQKDPGLLRTAIQTLVQDSNLRAKLGSFGRQVALERHDEVKVRDRFRKVLARSAKI
jgi:glycosyltransferase involved in cell wall biosynthesis